MQYASVVLSHYIKHCRVYLFIIFLFFYSSDVSHKSSTTNVYITAQATPLPFQYWNLVRAIRTRVARRSSSSFIILPSSSTIDRWLIDSSELSLHRVHHRVHHTTLSISSRWNSNKTAKFENDATMMAIGPLEPPHSYESSQCIYIQRPPLVYAIPRSTWHNIVTYPYWYCIIIVQVSSTNCFRQTSSHRTKRSNRCNNNSIPTAIAIASPPFNKVWFNMAVATHYVNHQSSIKWRTNISIHQR